MNLPLTSTMIPSEDSTMPEPTLGARIHRLQRIVADLEREDIELEDALQLFEEGVAHLRAADALVSRTELRVDKLLEESGRALLEPADGDA
jgi:exodeoxyribonuclease VII small subunit